VIQTIRKAWGVPELRKKIVFTLLILLIFRIGNAIPVPYINTTLLGNYLDSMSGTVLGLYNVMSGGAFAEATVFALGVQPYINSSIIIQLLTIAIPALERLARDGGEGVVGLNVLIAISHILLTPCPRTARWSWNLQRAAHRPSSSCGSCPGGRRRGAWPCR
jgi:preprotein translocase subunit SecY